MAKTTNVPAASFKGRSKHAKQVAKPFFGSMAGTVLKFERPFDPIPGEWDIDTILDPPSQPRRPTRKRR